jgi:AcrR family transcriptional regulator
MASTTRMTGTERKAAIVDAAVKLFAEKGFQGTTTRELSAAVGVSEPVLYQHFDTKRALYDAILESAARQAPPFNTVTAKATDPAPVEAGDDREVFTRLAEQILDWFLVDPRYIRLLLFSALEGHELSDLFYEQHIVVFFRTLTTYIERRIADGAFRPVNAYLAARAFASMIGHQGLAAAVFHKGDLMADRGELITTLVDIFLTGMRKTE